jgi:hypothetical protein
MRPLRRLLPRGALVSSLLALGACGGGGGSSEPAVLEATLESIAARSGTLFSSTAGDLGFTDSDADPIQVGSVGVLGLPPFTPSYFLHQRGLYSFSLGALPTGATVVQATLLTSQVSVAGAPFSALGVLLAEHVNPGGTIDGADFSGAALSTAVVLSDNPALGSRSVDATGAVQADLAAGRTRSCFRMRFAVQGTVLGAADLVTMQDRSDLAGTGTQLPVLVVRYQ